MLARRALTLLIAVSFATAVGACDDGGDTPSSPGTAEDSGSESTGSDAAATPDEAAAPDEGTVSPPDATPSPDTTPAPDVPPALTYPEGPYGYAVGDTAPDIELFDPFSGEWIKFSDYYKRYDKRVLFVSSAAGWCGPCQAEAAELVHYYDQFEDDGLEPLYALFEDTQGIATTIGSSATANFVQQWKDSFNVDYPLLIDPPRVPGDPNSFALEPFWESDGIPFAFMVTTFDMQVRMKMHGYNPSAITFEILTNLEIANDWWAAELAGEH